MKMKCTSKQLAFIQELVTNKAHTITEAALRAYPNCKNRQTAAVLGHKLLNNPYVLAAMAYEASKVSDVCCEELALERLEDTAKEISSKNILSYIKVSLLLVEKAERMKIKKLYGDHERRYGQMAKCDKCGKELELLICDECIEKEVKEAEEKKEE